MKKMIVPLFFTMLFNFAAFAEELSTNATASTEETALQADQSEVIVQNNDNTGMSSNSCNALPTDQQNFAMQLNSSNKNMFCNSFNKDQRKSAIQMMSKSNSTGTKMSADQAVEQVAKNNNIMPSNPSNQRSPGGCPTR